MSMFLKNFLLLGICLFLTVPVNAEIKSTPTKFYEGLQPEAKKLQAKYPHSSIQPIVKTLAKEPAPVSVNESHKKIVPTKTTGGKDVSTFPAKSSETASDATVYIVAKNDTLYGIARRFKVTPAQLTAWNNLPLNCHVYSGQKLEIFKNKQKHNAKKSVKKLAKPVKNVRDNSQKKSIISNNNKSMLKLYCQWPTLGKLTKKFSQTDNKNIEITGKLGQPIKAAAAGEVVATGPSIYGHGRFIVIRHNETYLSSYANNRRVFVKIGQQVTQGQVIAEMGKVGRKPASLEFELKQNNELVDPLRCLPKKI